MLRTPFVNDDPLLKFGSWIRPYAPHPPAPVDIRARPDPNTLRCPKHNVHLVHEYGGFHRCRQCLRMYHTTEVHP